MPQAVIAGNYADFKIVKTRSTAQLIIEIPIEQAAKAVEMFGIPQPGHEIQVAVARLDTSAPPEKSADRAAQSRAAYAAKTPGEQATVRAALLAREAQFQDWCDARDEAGAAEYIRHNCGIETRRAFITDSEAFEKFLAIELAYRQYAGQAARP